MLPLFDSKKANKIDFINYLVVFNLNKLNFKKVPFKEIYEV